MTQTIRFDLHGTSLCVTARAEHLRPLLAYLDPLRAPNPLPGNPSPGAQFDLTIGAGLAELAPPAHALPVFQGTLPEGVEGRMHEAADRRWLEIPGRLTLRLGPEAAEIAVTPGSEGLIGGSAGVLAIEAAAARSGQTLVHAAALTLPGQDRAFLLFAPSGAGKTTTALALALGGFGLLTDDAAFLRGEGPGLTARGLTAWGLPRPLKVHRRTAALLPAIAPLLGENWDGDDEQGLARATLARILPLPPPRPVPLLAIVFLGARSGEPGHRLAKLPRAELLLHLARDNVSNGPRGLPAGQLRRFQALAGAVAALPAYELRVGSDLTALARLVQDRLA